MQPGQSYRSLPITLTWILTARLRWWGMLLVPARLIIALQNQGLLTSVSGCCIICSRKAKSRDRIEKMVIHNLCGCSNKWERPFPILKPTKRWKKLWKLAPGNLYRLDPALKPLQVTHFPSNSFQMNRKGMILAEGNFQHSWWLYPKIKIFWDTGKSLIKNQFSFLWSFLY